MEYFELFGLQPHFNIDAQALKKKYFALSKASHPDFHTLSSEEVQADVLEQSTKINLAYKTLSNGDKLLAYILTQHELLDETQGNQIPQTFLMEMMEINEAIMELQFDPNEAEKLKIKEAFNRIFIIEKEAGQTAKVAYDDGNIESSLTSLKDHYFKMKYLNRIAENLK